MSSLKLYECLNRSIDSIDNWHEVLAAICEISGAKKAIIALRDSRTAELIIPDQVHQKFFSPLLFGFSESEVESYISNYALVDPWTKVEREHHPHIPYFLSTYLPITTLKTLEFWEWLKPQGISDSFILKLDDGPTDWVSLNLYFEETDSKNSKRIKSAISEILPTISRHWKLCRELSSFKQGSKISSHFMRAFEMPAMLLDANLAVIASNTGAKEGFGQIFSCRDQWQSPLLPKKIRERIETFIPKITNQDTHVLEELSTNDFTLSIRMLQNNEDIVGRSETIWLVTLSSKEDTDRKKTIHWENNNLTKREKEVVKAVSEGETMSDFAKQNGISLNTAKSYLRDARRKLGGIKAKDIYASSY